ncbi:hypothetical protein QTH97_31660 [Variovorax sp. J22R24]|uniref:hypothetical protein n=1 Tax=Variovorax gracilis TaxID=3053502 RepID=UPI002574B309|nr:hypothetical protein [Variovorax sp. J22R24]MDM0109520.1 hypothetical protein [Variovorax sp. J22R24]
MPSGPAANLSLLPWVRQGAAASISTADSLGAGQHAVAELSAVLSVNGSAAPPVTVRLRGPADVVGIDANQIVRRDPRPGSIDFEPNYFAAIEFDRPDFPWLFTPARADATGKLRPWLCLVVVRKQEGVSIGPTVDAPCTALQIAAPASIAAELPDLVDSWAWAHAQAAAADAAQVGSALAGSPALSLSRLLCPRILRADTDYIACVVPAFELGRKAGLGLPVADTELVAANALAPAWTPAQKLPFLLPVYHHWEFRTGPGGDFESLVRRLKPQPVPEGLGRRPIDIAQPGFGLPAEFPPHVELGLEGALLPMETPDAPAPWAEESAKPFQTALADIVNAPGLSEVADPDADPLLAPPVYGRWHAARAIVARGIPRWLDQLNLDPRSRTVAAFGTRVVQEHQEPLMAAAWEQAADLQRANQRMRQLQLSLAVGTSLHARHFANLGAETLLRIGSPAFARIRTIAADETAPRTLVARMEGRALPLAATSPAMRRIGRERGPFTRRIAAQGLTRSTTMTWVAKLNLGMTFSAPAATDQATVDAVRVRLPNANIRPYRDVTKTLIDGLVGRPNFQVMPEGAPINVPAISVMILMPDSPSAHEFRLAASEHLGRIDPGRFKRIFAPAAGMAMDELKATVLAQTRPRQTLVAVARAMVSVGAGAVAPVDTPASAAVGIDTIMAAPTFRQPMYEPLRDLSQDLLLPGLQTVLPDSVIGLKTNRRFVEAYMVGLNVEMARELLWRGFPTDQRGTCFDQFWDVRGAPAPRPDIGPLHLWADRPLADPATAPVREQFVMLMRSALLKRYPNAIVYAVPGVVDANGVRSPSEDAGAEVQPAFSGSMQPDVSFFGFDFTAAHATGADGSAGHYIVIQEHPTEPRFGLDEDTPTGGASHLGVSGGPPAGLPLDGLQWGRNGAHMAGIVRQLPVRIAIHASQLVKH